MFKLPFNMLPSSYGLRGKTRDIAMAEYELTGYELDQRLLDINMAGFDEDTIKRKLLDLKSQYKLITQDEYNTGLAEFIKDPTQHALAILELDKRAGKISDREYEKQSATIRGEPWIAVVALNFTKGHSLEGNYELDWNEKWVEKLKADGYVGPTSDNIVNQWFIELSRNIAMEEFDGQGDFTADSEANLEAMKRWSSESIPGGRKGYK